MQGVTLQWVSTIFERTTGPRYLLILRAKVYTIATQSSGQTHYKAQRQSSYILHYAQRSHNITVLAHAHNVTVLARAHNTCFITIFREE